MVKISSLFWTSFPFWTPALRQRSHTVTKGFFWHRRRLKGIFLSLSLAFRAPEHKRSYSSRDGVPHRDCNMFPVGRQRSVWTVSPAIPSANTSIPGTRRGEHCGPLSGLPRPISPGLQNKHPFVPSSQSNGLHKEKKAVSLRSALGWDPKKYSEAARRGGNALKYNSAVSVVA